jgi:hypothetical protein
MKYAADRPYADPEAAARKLVEIAAGIEPVQDGRIYIELVNAPFLYKLGGSGTEFREGLRSLPSMAGESYMSPARTCGSAGRVGHLELTGTAGDPHWLPENDAHDRRRDQLGCRRDGRRRACRASQRHRRRHDRNPRRAHPVMGHRRAGEYATLLRIG